MLTVQDAKARVAGLVAAARNGGADTADALYVGDSATDVSVRLGALEDVGRSEGEEIGLRVFVGRRAATVSSSDLSPAALDALVERAVAMAREAPEDPYAGPVAPEMLARSVPALDLDDGGDPDPATLRALALEAEAAAREVPRVSNSDGAGASARRGVVALALSSGFAHGYSGTSYSCSAGVIAGEGSAMQRDAAWHQVRHLGDLEAPAVLGRRAGERAAARLDPVKLGSGTMPVLFDRRVSASLLGHLLGAITGGAITRKTSFLLDALGTAVFAPGISIIDDPLAPRGLRSRPFDGEGLPTRRTEIVADGVLTGWLLDAASARQLGLQPTGHANRGTNGPPGAGATNLSMAPGPLTREAMIAETGRGLLVTELIGQGVNGVTGDYSRGASGFLIEDGRIGRPVAEITIAGNLRDMFRRLEPASDLELRNAVNAPTVRIDGMTVAGA